MSNKMNMQTLKPVMSAFILSAHHISPTEVPGSFLETATHFSFPPYDPVYFCLRVLSQINI